MHYETVTFMVSAASIQFCILSPKIGLETSALKVWDALAQILKHNVSKQENSPLARNGEIVILMALYFGKSEPQRSYKHGSYKKKRVYCMMFVNFSKSEPQRSYKHGSYKKKKSVF